MFSLGITAQAWMCLIQGILGFLWQERWEQWADMGNTEDYMLDNVVGFSNFSEKFPMLISTHHLKWSLVPRAK